MLPSRRAFVAGAAVSAAFAGYALRASGQAPAETYRNQVFGYGPLKADPKGLFDLPEGFSYSIVSQSGQMMDDGLMVPQKADGMACFPHRGSQVILVRNHELRPTDVELGPAGPGRILAGKLDAKRSFDVDAQGRPLPGGVSTIVYDTAARKTVRQHLSLTGTAVNCAGGPTPWGSWLTCEETVQRAGTGVGKNHGWVFEVPADNRGLVKPEPLTGLGRFQHEAAAVDPRTGVVYLTEDSFDHLGLFYRFVPKEPGRLAAGGRLQALGLKEAPGGGDVRNFKGQPVTWRPGESKEVAWIDLEDTDNPAEDLRIRGQKAGAAFVGRAEGVFFGSEAVYFACTSSGPTQHGQILRYHPSPREGQADEASAPGRLELYIEPSDPDVLDYGDNLAISPWGHMFVCEDRYSKTLRNHLRAVTPQGQVYTIGRNVHALNAELAGVCFSPDGGSCFVNIYQPGITLAITGPWAAFRA
ncbi:MAG TPA: alkaline phosphatase PhoX [Phenylobacterium sp.]